MVALALNKLPGRY